jgi:ribosomal protein S19E (S16A)
MVQDTMSGEPSRGSKPQKYVKGSSQIITEVEQHAQERNQEVSQ